MDHPRIGGQIKTYHARQRAAVRGDEQGVAPDMQPQALDHLFVVDRLIAERVDFDYPPVGGTSGEIAMAHRVILGALRLTQ